METGRQAVDRVRAEHFDLVLMDVHMPEPGGFAATAAIRQLEAAEGHGQHTPIVALTADALAGDAEKSLAAGMDDYLAKPITRSAWPRWWRAGLKWALTQRSTPPSTLLVAAHASARCVVALVLLTVTSLRRPDATFVQ